MSAPKKILNEVEDQREKLRRHEHLEMRGDSMRKNRDKPNAKLAGV